MSKKLDPFKTTTSDLHRITFRLSTIESWYAIMREARALYGRNWRTQPRVKRKLMRTWAMNQHGEQVWFEVPDPQFGTWCALKLAVQQADPTNK